MNVINLNDSVRFKPNEKGLKIYKEYNDDCINQLNSEKMKAEMRKISNLSIDKDGYAEMALWHFMFVYGKHLSMGSEPPFELEILIND